MPAKPDALDRLAQLLMLIAAVTTIANGLFMLVKPLDWYVFVPTVVTTGPPNAHFIRSEERRVGKEYVRTGRSRGSTYTYKNKKKQHVTQHSATQVIIQTI